MRISSAFAKKAIEDHVPEDGRPADVMGRFLERLSYVSADAAQDAGWADLGRMLKPQADRIRVFYLAVGPDLFGPICDKLGACHLVTPRTRVVIEKPLGKSGESARALNESIGRVFSEEQIYRIDHYLGKETVQNLMALRFANALFEPVWNAGHIDHVQITVAETLGVEGRAGYYDTAGALRDMVQNHMLQLLCLVAMEPPTSTAGRCAARRKAEGPEGAEARSTGDAAAQVTRARPVQRGRCQWRRGEGLSRRTGITARRKTETFVALKAEIANWRWSGVPFYLRTGKRLANARVRDRGRPSSRSRIRSSTGRPAPSPPTGWSSGSSPTRASSCG